LHDALGRACGESRALDGLDAVLQVRERLESEPTPTLLLVDDAHRLAEQSTEALRAVLRGIEPDGNLLVVVSTLETVPGDIAAEPLVLGPLDEESLRCWVGDGLPARFLPGLLRASGGFPSSVRALLDLLERGELKEWDLLEASSSLPLSDKHFEAVATLSSTAKRAFGLLVIVGGAMSLADVASLGVATEALEELGSLGIACREGVGWKLSRIAEDSKFLDALGLALIRRLHLDVATALASPSLLDASVVSESERKARLTHHLAQAAEKDRAVEQLLAGEPLHDLAPRSWRRAAQSVFELVQRPDVEVLLARLEHQAGDVRQAWDRLQALLSAEPDRARRVLIFRELGACAIKLGDVAGAIEVLKKAWTDADTPDERAAVSFLIARALTRRGDFRSALHECERGLSEAISPNARADLLEAAGVASSFVGDGETARMHLDQAASLWDRIEDPRRLARAQGSRALVEYRAGNLAAAAEGYRLALETAEAHGLSDQVATAALNLGTLAHQQGDWSSALTSYEQGMRMAVALGQVGTETVLRFNLAKVFADVGLFDRSGIAAGRCLDVAGRAGQPWMEAAARTVLGEVAAFRRDYDRAENELERALRAFQERGSQRECAEILLQLADIALDRGDVERASGMVVRAEGALEDADARDVRMRVDLGKARVALARSRPQEALPLAEGVSRGAEEIGQQELEAEAHGVLAASWETQGSVLLASKHRDRAREIWEQAAARLPESMRDSFWKHPRRAALRWIPRQEQRDNHSRREHKLELLIDINKRLNSSLEVNQVLTRAMDAAIELTGAERGFVLLGKEPRRSEIPAASASKALHVAIARNLDREQVGRSHLKFSRAIAEKVMRDGQPVVTVDARGDSRFRENRSVHAMQLQSVACVPVQSPSGILGALYLDNRFRPGTFGKEDVDLLLALADQVALALDNARLLAELLQRNEELEKQRRRVEALAKGQAAEIDRLTEVVRSAQHTLQHRYDYSQIVGSSPAMHALFDVLDRVIDTSLPVLIQGESGTGKELVARAVHFQGPHRDGPLVTLNCGAMPESLIESELFGHMKGAFTGADQDREGLVLKARGGTLFLDELGELPLSMQVKLLRVLQEREVRPLGASRSIPVEFRLVTATNRNLVQEVRKGTFREDLYYRVGVIELTLPPLRERIDDVPELARRLLERARERTQKAAPVLTSGALRKLMAFHWPGNVRQLENVLLRASVLTDSDQIRAKDIALPDPAAPTNAVSRDEFERQEMQRIADALASHRWNVALVARELGIPRPTLYRKLRRYGLVRGRR
jgi:transcriptional regulator with GAF, ATPase, and Fis domain